LRVKTASGKLYWRGMGVDAFAESNLSGSMTDEFIYFAGRKVARRNASTGAGNRVPSLRSGFRLRAPTSFTPAKRLNFADHLGSTRVLTNATGTILKVSDYYPFGTERIVGGSDPGLYKFTGYERDLETGHSYAIFRFHHEAHGRFMSPDLLGGSVDNPQSLNRYAYVVNDPVNLVDPLGLDPNDAIGSLWGSDCGSFTYATTHAECRVIPNARNELDRISREFRDYWDLGDNGPWGSTLGLPGGVQLPVPSVWDLFFPNLSGCSNPSTAFVASCNTPPGAMSFGEGALTFFKGRAPGQSFGDCMNENISLLTFGKVNHITREHGVQFAAGAVVTALETTSVTAQTVRGPVGVRASQAGLIGLTSLAGLQGAARALIVRGGAAATRVAAVATAAAAGALIGSAANCASEGADPLGELYLQRSRAGIEGRGRLGH
jgi:RHS repeat-associated protein